jgi:hypothetical protein
MLKRCWQDSNLWCVLEAERPKAKPVPETDLHNPRMTGSSTVVGTRVMDGFRQMDSRPADCERARHRLRQVRRAGSQRISAGRPRRMGEDRSQVATGNELHATVFHTDVLQRQPPMEPPRRPALDPPIRAILVPGRSRRVKWRLVMK